MVVLFLSPGRWLTRGGLLVCVGAIAVISAALWVYLGRLRPPLTRDTLCAARHVLGDSVVAVLGVLAGLTYGYLLFIALTVPQSVNDTLLYHLPRAAFWKQQHGLGYVADSPDGRINAFLPNAEIELPWSMVLSGGDRFVGLVQLASVPAAVFAIGGTALRLGFTRREAAFGALAFASFTVVLLQAPTALNDLVVMSFLMLAAFFATGRSKRELALGALALALAVGAKGTVLFLLPALAAFALAVQPPRRWLALAGFGVAGVGAGSYWYIVNLSVSGEASGGISLDRGADPLLIRIGRSFGDLFELSNGDGDNILSFPLWLVLAFGATVAIAILAFGRSTGAGELDRPRRSRGRALCHSLGHLGARLVPRRAPCARRLRSLDVAPQSASGRLLGVAHALVVRTCFRPALRDVDRPRTARSERRTAVLARFHGARGSSYHCSFELAGHGLRQHEDALPRVRRRARLRDVRSCPADTTGCVGVHGARVCQHRNPRRVLRSAPGGAEHPSWESRARDGFPLVRPGIQRER